MAGNKNVRVSAASRRILDSLAETIIPSEGPDRPGALDVDATGNLLEWLSSFRGAKTGFVLACWLWELSPLMSGRLARFSRMDLADRTRLLTTWESSRLFTRRWSLFLLKSIFMAAFYNDEKVWPCIGYEPGCLAEPPNPVD